MEINENESGGLKKIMQLTLTMLDTVFWIASRTF